MATDPMPVAPAATSTRLARWLNLAALVGIALLIGFYLATLLRDSVNIPVNDDFDSILGFCLRYSQAQTATDRLQLIFAQHNEHRIAFNNLVYLAQWRVLGHVDLFYLTLLGNLALACLLALLWRWLPRDLRRSPLAALPLVALLCGYQAWESMTWAMAALATYWVHVFALLAVAFAAHPGRRATLAAGVLGLAATYTLGNGLLVFLAIGLTEALAGRWQRAIGWLMGFVGATALYMAGYHSVTGHPSVFEAIRHPDQLITYFVTLLGAAGAWTEGLSVGMRLVAPMLGLTMLAFTLWLTATGFGRRHAAIQGSLLYLLATAAVLSLTRSGFGLDFALSSRYRILSLLGLALTYLALIHLIAPAARLTLQTVMLAFGTVSLAITLASAQTWHPRIAASRVHLADGLAEWQQSHTGLEYPTDHQHTADSLMTRAIEAGIYTPPPEATPSARRP